MYEFASDKKWKDSKVIPLVQHVFVYSHNLLEKVPNASGIMKCFYCVEMQGICMLVLAIADGITVSPLYLEC